MRASEPLRDEHRALLPEIGALRAAADAVGTAVFAERLESARRLVERHLLPHMAAEEAALYPQIDHLAGSDATIGMRRDHDEIRRRVAALDTLPRPGDPDTDHESELRAALYGLDAIVRLRLAKEEELYYPLLDAHFSGTEAVGVVGELHQVERDLYRQRIAARDVEGDRA